MSIRDLPAPIRALLRLALPEDWRDDIVRDLEEAWSRRRIDHGAARSGAWLLVQSTVFALRFAPERLAEILPRTWLGSSDLKLALRSVRRAPLVSLLAVVSLGVGIGVAVGGYTAIRGTLFTHLPFDSCGPSSTSPAT
mgnify:FL=1